jgi:uncharacterized membrane protein YphA (DoxX/SURF4 family)
MVSRRGIDWTLLFIGFVFLSAATYRIFNYAMGVEEFLNLKLPLFFLPFTIILEYLLATAFLFRKYVKYATLTAILFLTVAIIIAFITHFQTLFANMSELFFFKATPTDVFLHIVYIGILVAIYLKYRRVSKNS